MGSDSTIRLGLIGLGNIAGQHIENIQSGRVPGCRLAALCSRQPNELAAQLGVPHFSDYRELVDSGSCDAVLVATPTCSHFEIGGVAIHQTGSPLPERRHFGPPSRTGTSGC